MARDIYLNEMQQRIYYSSARDQRVSAARRFGKTDGTIAPRVYNVSMSMPRATNGWLGISRRQLYSKTVPGTLAAISRMFKLVEGVHFGWGRIPADYPQPIVRPKEWDNIIWFCNGTIWPLISLAQTGSANSYTLNSLIGDEMKFASKAKIDGEVMPALSGQTHPDGDLRFSAVNPLYKSTLFCSDASLTAKGNWLEKEEEKLDIVIDEGEFKGKTYRQLQAELDHYAMDIIRYNDMVYRAKKEGRQINVVRPEKKQQILALAAAIERRDGQFKIIPKNYGVDTKGTCDMCVNYGIVTPDDAELLYSYRYLITPDEHFRMMQINNSKAYQRHIQHLRCNAFTFYRASSLDNLDILGSDYIARMKRDLPPMVFAISILNMKQKKSNDGFYSNLDLENVHGYIPDDCPAIESVFKKKTASGVLGKTQIDREVETPDFDDLQKIKDCTLDGDVVDSLPLYLGFDYNANINWVCTAQIYPRDGVESMNLLSSMYVKNERKLHALMEDWHHYYAPHKKHNRQVYVFYDTTAKFRDYATENAEDFKDAIIGDLINYGWDVIPVDMGAPMAHEMKYKIINEALAGTTYPAIRINRENNEALCVALDLAEVEIGYRGFRKSKRGEKLSEDADNAVRMEYRTDGTDAFDQLYLGIKFHRNRMGGMCLPTRRRH